MAWYQIRDSLSALSNLFYAPVTGSKTLDLRVLVDRYASYTEGDGKEKAKAKLEREMLMYQHREPIRGAYRTQINEALEVTDRRSGLYPELSAIKLYDNKPIISSELMEELDNIFVNRFANKTTINHFATRHPVWLAAMALYAEDVATVFERLSNDYFKLHDLDVTNVEFDYDSLTFEQAMVYNSPSIARMSYFQTSSSILPPPLPTPSFLNVVAILYDGMDETVSEVCVLFICFFSSQTRWLISI